MLYYTNVIKFYSINLKNQVFYCDEKKRPLFMLHETYRYFHNKFQGKVEESVIRYIEKMIYMLYLHNKIN